VTTDVGRELRPDELRPRSIVVVHPPGSPGVLLTMWVLAANGGYVTFYSGVTNTAVVNRIRGDGKLVDDRDRVVRVFEYLGEP